MGGKVAVKVECFSMEYLGIQQCFGVVYHSEKEKKEETKSSLHLLFISSSFTNIL